MLSRRCLASSRPVICFSFFSLRGKRPFPTLNLSRSPSVPFDPEAYCLFFLSFPTRNRSPPLSPGRKSAGSRTSLLRRGDRDHFRATLRPFLWRTSFSTFALELRRGPPFPPPCPIARAFVRLFAPKDWVIFFFRVLDNRPFLSFGQTPPGPWLVLESGPLVCRLPPRAGFDVVRTGSTPRSFFAVARFFFSFPPSGLRALCGVVVPDSVVLLESPPLTRFSPSSCRRSILGAAPFFYGSRIREFPLFMGVVVSIVALGCLAPRLLLFLRTRPKGKTLFLPYESLRAFPPFGNQASERIAA